MKKILLILLVLLGFQGAFAQDFAIEHYKLNYAYPGIGNYLSVVVENENCENIIVKTDNGTIEKKDSLGCDFEFTPTMIGHAILSVFVVEKSDTTKIGERIYRIKRWPEHKPYIGRISSEGQMERAEFLDHLGVRVPMQHFDIDGRISVLSYNIEVVRNGERVCNLENIGGRFQEKNHEILGNIQVGDTVFIRDIKVKMPRQVDVSVSNLRIEIIN